VVRFLGHHAISLAQDLRVFVDQKVLVHDVHLSAVRTGKSRGDLEERSLARTVGPDNSREFTGHGLYINPLKQKNPAYGDRDIDQFNGVVHQVFLPMAETFQAH